MGFDRNRLIDNIYRVAKEKNIKIGTLEQSAGVSPGYLSRLARDDTKGSFAVDLLCSVSEQLGKTLDALVYTEHKDLTENEEKMLAFLDRLTMLTENFTLEWKMLPPMIQDETYEFEHPLFRVVDCCDMDPDGNYISYKKTEYCSHFLDQENPTIIEGRCFHVLFDTLSNREVYLMFVSQYEPGSFDRRKALEIYFIRQEKYVEPIVCSILACDQIVEAMERLYKTVDDARSHLTFDRDSISAIDRFLKA